MKNVYSISLKLETTKDKASSEQNHGGCHGVCYCYVDQKVPVLLSAPFSISASFSYISSSFGISAPFNWRVEAH